VEKKITLRQMTALYGAIRQMGEAGVSVRGMGMLDLAMNKAKIEPMIVEYEKMKRLPERINEYNMKISLCTTADDRGALAVEYGADITAFRKKELEITDLNDAERTVDLITIPKSSLIVDEKNGRAGEVLFGLLPVIEQ
jgi:hypothetical protein